MIEPQKTISKEKIYGGRIFDLFEYKVELPNKKIVSRDMLEHLGAAVILATTDSGDIVMVRQYRNGSDAVMLELPAGKLDENEAPIDCALRELEEETGYRAAKIEPMLKMYPVSAYCTEEVHLFLAQGLTMGAPKPDDDEFVEVEEHSLEVLLKMINDGEINDMKTIAGVLFYAQMS